MNSLNILTGRASAQQNPGPSRTMSSGNVLSSPTVEELEASPPAVIVRDPGDVATPPNTAAKDSDDAEHVDLRIGEKKVGRKDAPGWSTMPRRLVKGLLKSIRWLLYTVAAPVVFVFGCLYSDSGAFVPFSPIYKLRNIYRNGAERGTPGQNNRLVLGRETAKEKQEKRGTSIGEQEPSNGPRVTSSNSSSSGVSSESESDREHLTDTNQKPVANRHVRSKALQSSDEIAPARRSIRIKLHSDDTLRQRKKRKEQTTISQSDGSGGIPVGEISPATLKSPTSPSSLLVTRYPRAPAPPRPLIPRRQPSYTLSEVPSGGLAQKTLILDLDETLIHSMAKGSRMSTGHMVEVKLNTFLGAGEYGTIGPQHPILYYVHKRPHCDDFLRRVCKWYNLVIFTASVQEYADPVIDWLEQERKFFSSRYYRQHCTYRHGAFIKDLSSVEPDLSKVMILDNSPLSYMFHQDNAIPIEGWISDPTDNDLLHLVPLLEGLQYVTDVRAFLALRGGEDGKHMIA